MAVRVQPNRIQNLQQIEAGVAGPDGADRLFTVTAQFDSGVNAFSQGNNTGQQTQTFTVLLGPVLRRQQFIRAIAIASMTKTQVNLQAVPNSVAMSIVVIAALGYTLGARRFPWLVSLFAVFAFVFLHAGKGDMRAIYWGEDEDATIQPWKYPSFLMQWAHISAGNIASGKSQTGEESSTLLERASLMQLLLYTQMTNAEIALALGFRDEYYFSKRFKCATGKSPRTFRVASRTPAKGAES